jgi:hypothetical protein
MKLVIVTVVVSEQGEIIVAQVDAVTNLIPVKGEA